MYAKERQREILLLARADGRVDAVALPEEGAIRLDAGSTTHRFAEAIPAARELIVVGLARDPVRHMLAQAKVCLVAQARTS